MFQRAELFMLILADVIDEVDLRSIEKFKSGKFCFTSMFSIGVGSRVVEQTF